MVSLKVNSCTHSHVQGLVAIVYKINESAGGILICCQHGVISHDGTKGDYWVPYDKCQVIAKADAMVPFETELQEVQNLVLASNYESINQQRILYSKYHEREIGSNSPVKKGKGYTCKKGCGKNCGCKNKCMMCLSGCFCNGNCCA